MGHPVFHSLCHSWQVRDHLASHMLDILDPSKFNEFRGDLIPERLLKIGEERRAREEERRQKRQEYERMMEAQRKKVFIVYIQGGPTRVDPYQSQSHPGPIPVGSTCRSGA